MADDFARRGPCPSCGADAFDGRDGAFCDNGCRSEWIMRPAVDGVSDDAAAEARRLMGCE